MMKMLILPFGARLYCRANSSLMRGRIVDWLGHQRVVVGINGGESFNTGNSAGHSFAAVTKNQLCDTAKSTFRRSILTLLGVVG
jgi:hypothetical protein